MVFSRFFDFEFVGEIELDQGAVVKALEFTLGKFELDNAALTASHFLDAFIILEKDGSFSKASLLENAVLHDIIDTRTRIMTLYILSMIHITTMLMVVMVLIRYARFLLQTEYMVVQVMII